jgi:hypothetical protein
VQLQCCLPVELARYVGFRSFGLDRDSCDGVALQLLCCGLHSTAAEWVVRRLRGCGGAGLAMMAPMAGYKFQHGCYMARL